jgi:hypothetical protein
MMLFQAFDLCFCTYTVAHVASARCSGLAWHARAPFAVITASAAAARLHMTASETLISLRPAVIMFISAQTNFDFVRSDKCVGSTLMPMVVLSLWMVSLMQVTQVDLYGIVLWIVGACQFLVLLLKLLGSLPLTVCGRIDVTPCSR